MARESESTYGASLHVELAHAKLNLGLRVVGKREDGYHDILSVFQTVSLADRLSFHESAHAGFSCTDHSLPTTADNLVVKALDRFSSEVARTKAIPVLHLHLEKTIPVGAGLGGGSSDAAATLRGLNKLCGFPLDTQALLRLAADVGSDVPFCVRGGTALVSGRGETVEKLVGPQQQWYFVVVFPGVFVSTKWAYDSLYNKLTTSSPYLRFISSLRGGRVDLTGLLEVIENDFQAVVERANPIVAELVSGFDRRGALCSSMTGTGSTVYGIFDDRIAALAVCDELEAEGHRSFFCEPVSMTK